MQVSAVRGLMIRIYMDGSSTVNDVETELVSSRRIVFARWTNEQAR